MILYIDDSTNSAKPLYYQSLVLLFLPCEKFGKNDNKNELFVKAFSDEEMHYVKIKLIVDGKESARESSEKIDNSKYAQMKNLIGRTLFQLASDFFGIVPPWGISTGVKPVKLARTFVKAFGREQAYKVLCEDYLVSPSKAKMAVDACVFEDKMMDNMGDNPCSLYISIPFCPTKCNYCSFVSCTTPRLLSLIPDYLDRLKKELFAVSETVKQCNMNLKSIYIGGGTPAILDSFQINFLLDTVFSAFSADGCEFTFEAGRPDCITFDKLKILKDYDVSRISINTQTSNDSVLRNVGRSHTFSDYVRAMEMAKNIGFRCINTDLIAGLPGEKVESFCSSITDVASLNPENVTVHAFTLKKASSYRIGGEKTFSSDFADSLKMTDFAFNYLGEHGYYPYYVYRQKNTVGNLENVGYSKRGFESIYNVIMMGEYHTVFGVGAGSVTKIVKNNGQKVERIFSPKYPYEFLDAEKYKGFNVEETVRLIEER